MNNFSSSEAGPKTKVPKHLESLATTVFQSLFPPINPQTTPLKSIRRVLLLNREQSENPDDGSFILSFRHYAITTRSVGKSKPLRRIEAAEKLMATKTSRQSRVPNLGKLDDIADYLIGGDDGGGYASDATSGSEIDTDAEFEVLDSVARKVSSGRPQTEASHNDGVPNHGDGRVERRAVKLVELGPRMSLRLTKVEEGLCSGKVMWHEYVHKSKQEVAELEKRWERRRQEKEARKREQKANVERKKAQKAAQAGNGDAANPQDIGSDGADEDSADDYYDSDLEAE